MPEDTDEKRMTVRLPVDLHAAIAEQAAVDLRSVHNEIIALLNEALAARKKKANQGSGAGPA